MRGILQKPKPIAKQPPTPLTAKNVRPRPTTQPAAASSTAADGGASGSQAGCQASRAASNSRTRELERRVESKQHGAWAPAVGRLYP